MKVQLFLVTLLAFALGGKHFGKGNDGGNDGDNNYDHDGGKGKGPPGGDKPPVIPPPKGSSGGLNVLDLLLLANANNQDYDYDYAPRPRRRMPPPPAQVAVCTTGSPVYALVTGQILYCDSNFPCPPGAECVTTPNQQSHVCCLIPANPQVLPAFTELVRG